MSAEGRKKIVERSQDSHLVYRFSGFWDKVENFSEKTVLPSLKIFRDTSKYFGVIGNPLSHTLSPLLHTGWYEDLGLDYGYLVFPISSVEKQDLTVLYKFGVRGLSVTIPHKEHAFRLADTKDGASEAMKASNTLVLRDGSISAHNTDGIGAVRAVLEQNPSSMNGKVLVLGSGGSARGIAFSLLEKGNVETLVIAARNQDAGNEIVDLLNRVRPGRSFFLSLEIAERKCAEFSLVIHTTPLGMKGKDPGPVFSPSSFHSGQTVFDIVYNPLITPLVKIAQSYGAIIIPGSEMLLYQAAEQFLLFTGIQLESELIEKGRQRLRSALSGN